jgi:hypothetical protein
MNRFLGIDFSGNHLMWRHDCDRSNIWISDVRKTGECLVLDRLLHCLASKLGEGEGVT